MNCIIVHGCCSKKEQVLALEKRTYYKHWIPWTKNQLERKGIPTETPLMPEPWAPVYEKYKQVFEACFMDEKTILIGHSCGCAFLVRWLGETKRKIAKLILVAPWKVPGNDEVRKVFYTYPIDKSISERVKEIITFTADNEHPDGKRSLQMFRDALGGKLINLKGRGHYIIGDMGTEEFPELVKLLIL